MKSLLLCLLIYCLVFACKDSGVLPDEVNTLTGKWRLVSREVSQNGTTQWQNFPSNDSIFLYFSKYGEVVNSEGFLTQCEPTMLKINGSTYKIQFHSDPAKDAFAALCAECASWNIELQQTELILDRCSPANRMKFVKE